MSITFYLGVLNVVGAVVWLALYGTGVLPPEAVLLMQSLLAYVLTFFVLAAGAVFVPYIEGGNTDRKFIGLGTGLSAVAAVVYVGMIVLYILKGTLDFRVLMK